jgi:hypothetical protein
MSAPKITIEDLNARLEATVNRCLEKHVFDSLNEDFTRVVAKQCGRIFEEFGASPHVLHCTILDDKTGVQLYYQLSDYENTIVGKVSSI